MKRIRAVRRERSTGGPVGRALVVVLPGLWSGSVVALGHVVPGRVHVVQLLAATPVLACAVSGRRRCVLVGGACALIALFPLSRAGRNLCFELEFGHVLAITSVIGAAYLVTGRRARLTRELERTREVAVAAQGVLLRPLPRRVGTFAVAGTYLSASRGARIGGDLYEVLSTPYGVRVVLGDVRGHGLSAVGTVAALLGCFREAAHDEPELAGVLRRMDRAFTRHLRERALGEHPASGAAEPPVVRDAPDAEEFATVLLVQLGPEGRLSVLNCGHPWPYLIDAGAARTAPSVAPLTTDEAMPPLGVLDEVAARPDVVVRRLPPGRTLFLHTDGAQEARDASRAFFPLVRVLGRAARHARADGAIDPALLVGTTQSALEAHVDGRLSDDVALLALARDPERDPAVRDGEARHSAAGAPL